MSNIHDKCTINRYGDGRTPKTEELQKQKNSNDNGTPIF